MDDTRIIELYFARDEVAIRETASSYGKRLDYLAFNILKDSEDSSECVSDTYLKTWDAIPPQKPTYFYAFIAKICRNLCFGRLDYKNAQKRNGQIVELSAEMANCIPDSLAETAFEEKEMRELWNAFLKTLSAENRLIFMRRYWFCEPIAAIAARCKISESKVKSSLHRTRKNLRAFLEKEGIAI